MELPKGLQIILQQFVEQYQVSSWNITTSNKIGSIRINFKMADISPQVMKYRKVSPSYLRRLKKRSDQRNENNYESLCESNNRDYEKDECIKFTNDYINLLDYREILGIQFTSDDTELEICEQSTMCITPSLNSHEYMSVEQSIFTSELVECSSNPQYSASVSYQQSIMTDESETVTAESYGYAIIESHDLSNNFENLDKPHLLDCPEEYFSEQVLCVYSVCTETRSSKGHVDLCDYKASVTAQQTWISDDLFDKVNKEDLPDEQQLVQLGLERLKTMRNMLVTEDKPLTRDLFLTLWSLFERELELRVELHLKGNMNY